MDPVILSYRARQALMFLASLDGRWVTPCMNEDALDLFEELEDARLIDVEDHGDTLILSINAAGAQALGFTIQ